MQSRKCSDDTILLEDGNGIDVDYELTIIIDSNDIKTYIETSKYSLKVFEKETESALDREKSQDRNVNHQSDHLKANSSICL